MGSRKIDGVVNIDANACRINVEVSPRLAWPVDLLQERSGRFGLALVKLHLNATCRRISWCLDLLFRIRRVYDSYQFYHVDVCVCAALRGAIWRAGRLFV